MRQVGLRLGLLIALALNASAPSLQPQEAEKAQQAPGAPAQDAAKPQPPAAAQTQTQTVTCTVDTSPKPLSAPLADALHLYRTGKFDAAAAAYNAIAASGGSDAVLAYTGLARVYLKQNKPSDAFDAASNAVGLTPGKTPAITALGEVYFRQGKLQQAEQLFLKPLQDCDADARSYLGLSRIDRATSDYNRAKSAVIRAYNLDPDDPEIGRAYIATLSPSELKVLRENLGREPNEEARNRDTLERKMALFERESGQPVHTCHPTSKVTATQTALEAMFDGPRRIRGYGLTVKVNGASARLLLDTGADGIVIDQKIADKAGVRKVVEHDSKGIGDKAAAAGYIGFADSIEIGDLQFEGCYVDVLDRNSVMDDDGLIGADVFSSYLVDIDFPDTKFKLTQLAPYPDEAPAETTLESRPSPSSHLHDRYIAPEMKGYTPIFRFGHALLIPTKVNDSAPMLFLIDTGSFDNTITPAAAKQVTKISREENFKVKGINGEVKDIYRADKANLQFAHFKQDRQDLVTFNLDNISNSMGTELSGILGFRMLRLLDIKIDYRDGLVDFIYTPPGSSR
ncbi:MAG: aspartyl protease family protein [Candidatus Acidiferrales bacterium]